MNRRLKLKDVIVMYNKSGTGGFNDDYYYLFKTVFLESNEMSNAFAEKFRTIMTQKASTGYIDLNDINDVIETFLKDGESLAHDYYMNHSYEKYISPMYRRLFDVFVGMDDVADNEKQEQLQNRLMTIIINRFGFDWFKTMVAFISDYKPLENYRMEETRTPDITKSHTGSESKLGTVATDTDITQDGSNESETGLFPFESSSQDATPTNAENTSSSVRTHGTSQNNKTTSSDSKSETVTERETGTESLTRSGNIGVTTSQQMLQSEIELRKYDIIERIFNDIDKVLCLKVY